MVQSSSVSIVGSRAQSFTEQADLSHPPSYGLHQEHAKSRGIRAQSEYVGVAFRHLFAEHGSQKIAMLMRHYRHGVWLGRAVRIGLRWFQFINGISFFDSSEHPDRLLPHAVVVWFISIRDYLAASGFGLNFTKPLYTVSTRRNHDKVLTNEVLRTVKTPTKIQQINKVRLFLRVEWPIRNMHRRRTRTPRILVSPNTIY
jgi:hypothetical protein